MSGTSRRWKIVASLVSFTLIGSGLHFAYTTGFFGHDELCGDLVDPRSVESALPHLGRISSSGAGATGPRPSMDCRISRTSALPGLADEELHVYTSVDRADFPFTHGGSAYASTTTFFSGGSSGAVTGAYQAWTWLPPACSDRDLVRVVATVTSEHSADRRALAGLTVDTANRLMDGAGCDAPRLTAPSAVGSAPDERRSDPQALCGVDGFSLPASSTGPAANVREIAPASRGPVWSCFVALNDDSGESARGRGFATYTVVQEPALVAGMKKSDAFSENSPVAGWKVSGFDDLHVVADCGGTDTYFAMEVGPQLTRTWEVPGSPGSSDLFAAFVSAVGEEYGCSGITGQRTVTPTGG